VPNAPLFTEPTSLGHSHVVPAAPVLLLFLLLPLPPSSSPLSCVLLQLATSVAQFTSNAIRYRVARLHFVLHLTTLFYNFSLHSFFAKRPYPDRLPRQNSYLLYICFCPPCAYSCTQWLWLLTRGMLMHAATDSSCTHLLLPPARPPATTHCQTNERTRSFAGLDFLLWLRRRRRRPKAVANKSGML
jgi:hypothetical protein